MGWGFLWKYESWIDISMLTAKIGNMIKVKPLKLRHEMMILDADLIYSLDESRMNKITKNLTQKLLKDLKMKPLGKLEVYPAIDMGAPGWSFIQPITTSHISGHYFAKPGPKPHIHMDIYSCKKFNWKSALKIITNVLEIGNWSLILITRNIDTNRVKMAKFAGNRPIDKK